MFPCKTFENLFLHQKLTLTSHETIDSDKQTITRTRRFCESQQRIRNEVSKANCTIPLAFFQQDLRQINA